MPADLTTLTYRCSDAKLASLVDRAAETWNGVLVDLVRLQRVGPQASPNIVIGFDSGSAVRNPQNPTRVAVCRHLGPDSWTILLASNVDWSISAWSRFWGTGENALAAIVHEMGHVFSLPHASDPNYVMHPEIGGKGKLSRREREQYRCTFLQILESEA